MSASSSRCARWRPLAVTLAGLAAGALVLAHVPLLNPGNGNELHWNSSEVSVVIQEDGSDDISDRGHFPALRNAIAAWNGADGKDIQLVEDTSSSQQARSDWESSGVHLLYFDESNASGYFPTGSGVVAVTPIFFANSGRIVDADVLFNGRGFHFTTSGSAGAFDVSDVATHELGHLLGLDHSAWAGASMYPYVDPSIILHRSLSLDDEYGLRATYPQGSYGSIRGRLLRSEDETRVAGAHVVARNSAGRPVAGTLTSASGVFVIKGLEPDTYEVYASPLGEPVSAANLGEGWDIDTDFQSTILGLATVDGEQVDMDEVLVDADASVNLGRASDDYPMRVIIGEDTSLNIRGTSLAAGGSLTCSDPLVDVELLSALGILVQVTLTVPEGATPGHVDLMFTTVEGDRSILTGGIELTPPDPSVDIVSPASGTNDGGAALILAGSGFRAGDRVVIGDSLYEDGVGGCEVVDSETITLTTVAMIGGLHDVVVIDPSGVEGRLVSGYRATAQPVLTAVFPEVGSANGGTVVFLTGDDFVTGMSVSINGIEQESVDFVNPGRVLVTTLPAAAGGPYVLTVRNPAGAEASAAFTYLDNPDPILASISPDAGTRSGGTQVTITGSNFDETTQVFIGVEAAGGAAGEAAEVEFVSSTTLIATTPSSGVGLADVVVQDPETSQAAVLPGAFEFESNPSSDSSSPSLFGGCASVRPAGPTSVLDVLLASGWLILALALGLARWHWTLASLRAQPLPVACRSARASGSRAATLTRD